MKRLFTLLSLFVISSTLFLACDDDNDSTEFDQSNANVVEIAQDVNSLSTLVQAVIDAGLATTLSGDGPFTIFAPTDVAFGNLPDGTLESLTVEQLADILTFHVIEGAAILSSDLAATQLVETINGERILVEVVGGAVRVNNSATVVSANLVGTNGVIHIIDGVLLPDGIRANNIIDQARELGNFTTLVNSLDDTGLLGTAKYKGDFTVFAPTDDAFNALPAGLLASLSEAQLADILTYHLINSEVFAGDLSAEQAPVMVNGESTYVTAAGGTVTVNGNSTVVAADVDVSNGVIHAIDTVLLPDAYGTIVDAASKRYFFQTLVQAVVDAGLAGALSDAAADLTVFAPTDEAFANLPAGLLDGLTVPQLAEILSYHVINANIPSTALAAEQDPQSLTDERLFVTVGGGNVTVNGNSTVVTADVNTNNGVIHAIDTVLLPDAFGTIVDAAAKRYFLSTLVSAVVQAELADDLSAAGTFTVFAPTNDAFAELETIPSGQALIDVLLYHVIPSTVLSGDLQPSQTVTTLNGATVDITVEGDVVTINGTVQVSRADLETNNGVIHVIDGVLLPPAN